MELDFFKGRRVFVTGHTGFKGSWMCKVLSMLGAEVTGYALKPDVKENLFDISDAGKNILSTFGDIRDLSSLQAAIDKAQPEVVIHMAAQPIVRESYKAPVYTYETNVMGSVNICEAVRQCGSVRSFVNVTTDKVYRNNEWERGYIEEDILDGFDPYSNSKSCSELVTSCYRKSFLDERGVAVSTCRAGNVIGGGDFAKDRIIPDCVRAAKNGEDIIVRNPYSVRPYQHVLEPVVTYLMLAAKQYDAPTVAGSYNIGPEDRDCITTGSLVQLFCDKWGGISWKNIAEEKAPHEAGFLKLNCNKIRETLGYSPRYDIEAAVEKTVEWSKAYFHGENVACVMEQQINDFLKR